jgi:hypothetical protein
VDSRSAGENGRPSDLVRVTYLTAHGDEHLEERELLKLYRQEEFPSNRSFPDEGSYVLLDGRVKSLIIEYYDGSGWLNVWNDPALPKAVRADIVLQRSIPERVGGEAKNHDFKFRTFLRIPVGAKEGE